jgi:hypothetical protein
MEREEYFDCLRENNYKLTPKSNYFLCLKSDDEHHYHFICTKCKKGFIFGVL